MQYRTLSTMKPLSIFKILFLVRCCFCKSFSVNILAVDNCTNPKPPIIQPLPYKLDLEVYKSINGRARLKVNLTVEKDISGLDKEVSILTGKQTRERVQWIYHLRKLNCSSDIIKNIAQKFGVTIKECKFQKGTYFLKDIDVEAVNSAFPGIGLVYGEYVCEIVVFSKSNSFGCWKSHFSILPVKKP